MTNKEIREHAVCILVFEFIALLFWFIVLMGVYVVI